MSLGVARSGSRGLESGKDQVSMDVRNVVQAPKSELMAKGVAFDLLQMAKGVGPQYKAAEYEDLSGEKNLTLDRIVADDRRSHQAFIVTTQWNSQ